MGFKIVDQQKVGPGKPPKHSQFKPGQSGNPTGRPKGSKNLATLLEKEMNRKITITENGKQKRITCAQAISRRLVTESVKGNSRLLGQLLKTMAALGKNPDQDQQKIDKTMPDPAALARIQKRLASLIKGEQGDDASEK